MQKKPAKVRPGGAGHPMTALQCTTTVEKGVDFVSSHSSIPTLTFLSGATLGKELPLVHQQITIGRGEESDIVVGDPSISREHIRLTCRRVVGKNERPEVKVVLEDLKSKNGTRVNYRKINRAVLKPGDKICIGSTILKYENRDLADQKFFEQIHRLATIDSLTSLNNRFRITELLSEEIARKHRYPGCLSLLMIDIDDFKSLNDTYGHLLGDQAIQTVASVLKRNLRKQDKAGRLGGEEFLVVLPSTDLKGAATLANRICRDLEKSVAKELRLKRAVTVSIGVASCPGENMEQDKLLDLADRALYRAKGRGKNRVELWCEKDPAPP